MKIIIMGVAGAGKTTVGKELAEAIGYAFIDADDHHPPANIEKMSRGEALTDVDRGPWLEKLGDLLVSSENVVLACSALKKSYRDALRKGGVRFVYLAVSPTAAAARLAARPGHFFSPELIQDQFDTLEEPANALVIDGELPTSAVVSALRRSLRI